MKKALRFTIQGFWAFIGAMSVWMLAQMIWQILFGHRPPSIVAWVLVPFIAFLLAALIFAAWSALFHFSSAVVRPCVFIVTLVLLSTAMRGQMTYVQPLVERDIHRAAGSIMPCVALLTLILIIAATVKFYRITSVLIIRLLFQETAR